MQHQLFTEPNENTDASQLPDSIAQFVDYQPSWLSPQQVDYLCALMNQQIEWQQPEVKVFGKWHKIPRKQAWFGDVGLTYEYSGKKMVSHGWPEPLARLKSFLEQHSGHQFNSTLLNYYRDGADKMGWHSDDESELGESPVVAIISLGAQRDIQFRLKGQTNSHSLSLSCGSLLLMKSGCQEALQHQIPARRKVTGERYSLTFRLIKN